MRAYRFPIAVCQMAMAVAGATLAAAAQQPPQPGPCRQIAAACRQAGFVLGGVKTGEGLQVDCIRPIMLGTDQPRRAAKPLPPIDPQLVAACKAVNPNFGQGNAAAETAEPPGGTPPPGAAAPPEATEPAPAADQPPARSGLRKRF